MLPISVSEGNQLQWNSVQRPFYETYYLKVADPYGSWSFWARYTLLIPRRKAEEMSASVWAIFCPKNENPVALKKTFSLSELDIFHRDSFIKIEDSFLALDKAVGFLKHTPHQVSWELEFEDPTITSCLYPYVSFYKKSFPKTKFMEPRLSTFISGQITVNGKTTSFERLPGHQAHIWGREYALSWAWGHCNTFEEDPNLVFEGLTARVPLGPFKSPSLKLLQFFWEGKQYRANTFISWLTNQSNHDLLHWDFEAICGTTRFVGHLTRNTSQIVGVEYQGPNGDKHYCHNSMLSSMELSVYRKNLGKWNLQKKYHSPSAAFETVESYPDSRVAFLL